MKGLYSVDYFPEEWQGPDCEIELYEDEAELALMNFLKFIQEEDGYAPLSRAGMHEFKMLRATFNADEYSMGMYAAGIFFLQNASASLLKEFQHFIAEAHDGLGERRSFSPMEIDSVVAKYCYAIRSIRKPVESRKIINSYCSTKVPLAFCFRTDTDCDGYAKHWCSDSCLTAMLSHLSKNSYCSYDEFENACFKIAVACGQNKYNAFIMLQALMVNQLVAFFHTATKASIDEATLFEDITHFAIRALL